MLLWQGLTFEMNTQRPKTVFVVFNNQQMNSSSKLQNVLINFTNTNAKRSKAFIEMKRIVK